VRSRAYRVTNVDDGIAKDKGALSDDRSTQIGRLAIGSFMECERTIRLRLAGIPLDRRAVLAENPVTRVRAVPGGKSGGRGAA